MSFVKDQDVVVVGGPYKGQKGMVTAVRNSTRDGRFYMVEFDTALVSVQVAEKFLQADGNVVQREVDFTHLYEGKGAVFPKHAIKHIIEHSKNEDDKEKKFNLFQTSSSKQVLITLVYELDGVKVANVVFQGMYAVVPLKYLTINDAPFDGDA